MSPDATRPDTSARIIAATFALLAERGLTGITMSAIADRAGVARQTLYNHYPDVDSILAAALAEHQRDDLQSLTTMLGAIPTPMGRLEHLVRHTAVNAGQHGTMPALHGGLSPAAQEAAQHYRYQIRRIIREVLADAGRGSELAAGLDPDLHAVLVHHILDGAAELAADRPDDVAQIADTTIAVLRAALRQGAETPQR